MNPQIERRLDELAAEMGRLVGMSRGHLEIHYYDGKPEKIDEFHTRIRFRNGPFGGSGRNLLDKSARATVDSTTN